MRLASGMVLGLGLAVWSAVGCDDTRAVADLGPGGATVALGGAAGEPGAAGGGRGGEGGAGPAVCPSDIFGADGRDCSAFAEGTICSDGGDNPCEFGQAILCIDGKWQRQESFPAPCGGAGGAAGSAGAGGG